MNSDRFGFLPYPHALYFAGGSIVPLADFPERLRWVKDSAHRDGHLYPPQQWEMAERSPIGHSPPERVPNTGRPARLWRLEASHELTLEGVPDVTDLRSGVGAFVLHSVAYLFGYRLQFEEWFIDGRAPIARSTHGVVHLGKAPERFLGQALLTWSRWSATERLRFTNLLYLHARVPSYEWEWERFTHEYMVTDALYRHFVGEWGKKAETHPKRISLMLHELGLFEDVPTVEAINALRRGLFHEGLWDEQSPGIVFSERALELTEQLRSLNQRLIPALLGYRSSYVSGAWTDWRSPLGFD